MPRRSVYVQLYRIKVRLIFRLLLGKNCLRKMTTPGSFAYSANKSFFTKPVAKDGNKLQYAKSLETWSAADTRNPMFSFANFVILVL